jgi:hypothetical protein
MNFKDAKYVPYMFNDASLIAEFIKRDEITVNENNWAQNNFCLFNDIPLAVYHLQILLHLSVQFIFAKCNKMITCFGTIKPF